VKTDPQVVRRMDGAAATSRLAGGLSRAWGAALGVAFAAVALTALAATPAAAHGRGSDATNFRSSVVAQPDLPGVRWQVHGADEFLSVSNSGAQELLVEGYEGEPYLRVGPDGVFVNRNSEATYLNGERFANVTPPAGAGPEAEPDWQRLSAEGRWLWHDHRIHWMSPAAPPQVQGRDAAVLVQPWSVPFRVGERRLEVTGELWWVPGPSPWPWLVGALLLTAPALIGLWRGAAWGSWQAVARPAALMLGTVAALNLVHLVDDLFAVPLPGSTRAVAALQTVMFIAVGLLGALRAWRGGDGAFTALGVGAGAVFVGQGLLYLGVLGASQTASVFPDWLARLVVALSLAQAVPVGIIAVEGTRRLGPPLPQPADEGAVSHP
jgi:hypothetical protein